METLNAVFAWLLRTSWQASVLVGLVLLTQRLFRKKLSPGWRYALWMLVLARLVMPVSPQSPASLFNLTRVSSLVPLYSTLPSSNDLTTPPPRTSGSTVESGREPGPLGVGASTTRSEGGSRGPTLAVAHDPTPAASIALHAPRFTLPTSLPFLWLTGVFLLVLRMVWQNARFARCVLKQRQVTNSVALDVLEDCKQCMNLQTPLTVIETAAVKSPALYGFVRPRLVLPQGTLAAFTPQELHYIFLHELAHVKRCDMAVNWLISGLRVLHWFNPILWFGFRRMAADREIATDALALAHTPEGGQQGYGQTIIKLLEGFTRPAVLSSLVGILEDKKQMKTRITMIAQFEKMTAWPSVAFALLLALGLTTLTDAQTKNTEIKRGQTPLGEMPAVRENKPPSPIVKKVDLPERVLVSAAEVGLLSISPNGRKVAFVPDESFRDVDVVDIIDGSSVRVTSFLRKHTTNQFSVDAFLWSHESDRLVFSYYPNDNGSTNQMISLRLVSAAGGRVQTFYESYVARIEPHDWSHDGKWILATVQLRDQTTSHFLIPTDGAKPKQIPSFGEKVKLSPDGNLLVFERRKEGRLGVFLSSIKESGEIPIGPADQANMSPQWSRDGRYVIFKSNRFGTYDFWAQRIEGGKPTGDPVRIQSNIAQTSRPVQVLNDGRLVFSSRSMPAAIYRVAIDPETGEISGQPKLITSGRNGVPSDDGRWVAYNSFDFGTGGLSALGLRVVSVDGKDERTLVTDAIDPYVEDWFPDGKSLLFGGWRKGRGIHRIELATGKVETLFSTNRYVSDARLSPDGQRIAFGADPFGPDSRLYVMKAQRGAELNLLRSVPGESSADPTWSPDGTTIAFASENRTTGASRLLTISRTGGEVKELVKHEQEIPDEFRNSWRWLTQPAWSPNGKFIVYSRIFYAKPGTDQKRKEEAWMLRLSDGKTSLVNQFNGFGAFQFHWSADGNELLFSGEEPDRRKQYEYAYWTLENYLPEEKRSTR